MNQSELELPVLNQTTFAGRLSETARDVGNANRACASFEVVISRDSGDVARVPCVAKGTLAKSILSGRASGAVIVTGALSEGGAVPGLHVSVVALQFLERS